MRNRLPCDLTLFCSLLWNVIVISLHQTIYYNQFTLELLQAFAVDKCFPASLCSGVRDEEPNDNNVVKCRSTHSEVVTEFSLIFSESPIRSIVSAFKCPCGYYRMLPKLSFSPLQTSSPPEMKQTQEIKPPIPHGSHVDCSASLTKLTALQAPIAIFSVCVYTRPGLYWWQQPYRRRHRHRFCRCVYARPQCIFVQAAEVYHSIVTQQSRVVSRENGSIRQQR